MKYAILSSFVLVFAVLLSVPVQSQDLLSCPADSIQLDSLEFVDNTFVRLHLKTFASPSAIADQTITHTYFVGPNPFMDVQQVQNNTAAFFLESLTGSHEFEVTNTCFDGDQHEGATLYVSFTFEEDLNCPPITNLVIDEFNNDFIAFSWADTSIHISYEVTYQPGVAPGVVTGGLTTPMFEQNLSDAIVHTFTIVAFCDDPGPMRDIVASPPVTFSVITVGDIKLLQERRDSVVAALPRAFRINTCCAQFQNTVNKTDVLNNLDNVILNPDSCQIVDNCTTINALEMPNTYLQRLEVYPNPAKEEVWMTYDLTTAQQIRIDLLDVNGRPVIQPVFEGLQASETTTQKVTINQLAPGIYFLRIRGEYFEEYAKILVK